MILVSVVGVGAVASGFAVRTVDGAAARLVEPPKLVSARTTALTAAAPRKRCKRVRDRGGTADGENCGMSSQRGTKSVGVAAGWSLRGGVVDHHFATDDGVDATPHSGVTARCAGVAATQELQNACGRSGVGRWRTVAGTGGGVAFFRAAAGTGGGVPIRRTPVGAGGGDAVRTSGCDAVGARGRSSAVGARLTFAGGSELASVAAFAVDDGRGASSAVESANAVASWPIAAASASSISTGSFDLDPLAAGGVAFSAGALRTLIRCAAGRGFVRGVCIQTPGGRSLASGAGIGTFVPFVARAVFCFGGALLAFAPCDAITSRREVSSAVSDVDREGGCSADSKTTASVAFECRELIVEHSYVTWAHFRLLGSRATRAGSRQDKAQLPALPSAEGALTSRCVRVLA
jgi:hypothetical protein